MSNTVKFVSSFTTTTPASAHEIWATWSNVAKWHAWDDGTESAMLKGEFAPGSVVTLTPKGGKPLQVELTSVVKEKEFSDKTVLPSGGVVYTTHRIASHGKHNAVTYEISAEVPESSEDEFVKNMWAHLQGGISDQVNNVIAIARSR